MKIQFTVQSFYRNFNTLLASLFARCSLPKYNIQNTQHRTFPNDFPKYNKEQ